MMAKQPLVLNVSHYMPPDHGTHVDFIAPWAKAVEAATEGGVSVIVHDGSSPLGRLEDQYAQVTSGIVDVAHSPAVLPPGRFPLTLLLNLPFMVAGSDQGTRMLWRLLQSHLADEYAGLHVLALHADSGGVLHTRDRLIARLEDLAGMRLRCPPGPMEAVLTRLGAVPVPLNPPQIYAAATQQEIDGAVMAWDVLAYTRTDASFRYHTDTALYVSPLYFVMNGARWSSLPAPTQQAIDAVSGPALIRRLGEWWHRWESPGRTIALSPGHTVTQLSSAELSRWQRAAAACNESYVDSLVRAGIAGARDTYDAMLALESDRI